MSRYKNKVEESFGELWKFVLDLQYETGKIKKAVLTGEKGDLKMPEEIPSEQTDNEYLKEQFGIYSRYVKSLSICTHVLTVISIIALTISIVALIV
ncbi:hypothetical protein DXA08_09275 [Blautia obeum]|nr:hypothetical protein DXA08_09275 [Blautia obeum]DAP30164.1 MAG TPA: hypothetical protein [Caudoviricetes sp.]